MDTLYNLFFVTSAVSSITNYKVQNINNIYNLLISIISRSNEAERKKILEDIRVTVGLTFYNDFKNYIFKKYPIEHELVKLVA